MMKPSRSGFRRQRGSLFVMENYGDVSQMVSTSYVSPTPIDYLYSSNPMIDLAIRAFTRLDDSFSTVFGGHPSIRTSLGTSRPAMNVSFEIVQRYTSTPLLPHQPHYSPKSISTQC